MSAKFHGATTAAEWAIYSDREMRFRISTRGHSSMYSLLPQERGGLALKCHDSGCCLQESGHTKHKGWNRTNSHVTNGSSLKAHNRVFLWHRDNALPIVEWAGNSLQDLVWEISWSNDGCGMSHLPWHYFSAVPKWDRFLWAKRRPSSTKASLP